MARAKDPVPKTNPRAKPARVPYVRTAKEQAGVDAWKARRDAAPSFPKLKVVKDAGGAVQIASVHSDEPTAAGLQMEALGLVLAGEFTQLIKDVANLTSVNGVDESQLNEGLAIVVGIGPTNTTEALLAVQMLAVHRAMMTSAIQLKAALHLEQAAVHSKSLNALGRTFALQAETLKKVRSSGEQKVVVEHRHYHLAAGAIAPGAKAVLGDMTGGGVTTKLEDQSHEGNGLLLPERAAMLSTIEADGLSVQSAGNIRQEGLQVPRRARRSTKG